MRVRRTIRTVLIVLATIMALIGIRFIQVFVWPGFGPSAAITVSRETTYFTGPLNDDGTVNYVAAVNQRYGKGVTPENNAAVLVTRAVGLGRMTKANRREFLARLGISSPPKRGDCFVTLDDYVVRDLDNDFHRIQGQLWAAKDYPVLADWLKANEKPLSLLVAASRRSRYFVPLVSSSQPPDYVNAIVSGPSLSRLQSMSEALAARAMLRAGREDFEGAHSDLMALHRLARLVATAPVLVDKLVGAAMAVRGQDGHLAIARAGSLTAVQARRVVADLNGLAPMADLIDAFDVGERLFYLSAVVGLTRTANRSEQEEPLLEVERASRIAMDWDHILRTANVWYDRWVEALGKKTFAERVAAFTVLDQDLSDMVSASEIYATRWGWLSLGARMFFAGRQARRRMLSETMERALFLILANTPTRGIEIVDRRAMRSDLVKVSMALTAYRIERGEYPAKLSDLSPDYLAEIPLDRFVDRPLLYRREGGGCVVYSVGVNMNDDGGRKNDESWDDVVVRLGSEPPATMPAGGE